MHTDSEDGNKTDDEGTMSKLQFMPMVSIDREVRNHIRHEEDQSSKRSTDIYKTTIWFSNASMLICEICSTYMKLCKELGNVLLVDEMLVKFCAQSSEMHILKYKYVFN